MTFPLNEGQERAASTLQGPVLVSAGAGTGKTRALTERFVRAVVPGAVGGWDPADVSEVLTITFTEKAAGELAERIRSTLRAAGMVREARVLDGAWISTIHGFCARILRSHALEAGLDPGFAVADETAARELRERAFESAARLIHDRSSAARDLFALWGFGQVWEAVSTLAMQLETRGLGVDEIELEPCPDMAALHAEAVHFFTAAEGELLEYAGTLKSAASHAAACRTLLDEIGPRCEEGEPPEESAMRLWRALTAYSAGGGSARDIKERCAQIKDRRGELIGESVAAITAPAARVLRELTRVYLDELAALKTARGVLDFADLQLHADRLLAARGDLCERYRDGFRLVMVDEFQDTDELQMRLVDSVSRQNLCTVGDERQSIYRFRGADLRVYQRHRNEMAGAGAEPVSLTENYRSHREIIGFVNGVFSHAALFGGELLHLKAERAEAVPPLVGPEHPRVLLDLVHSPGRSKATSRRTEAAAIASRLRALRDDEGVSPGDMVVLVRRYASAEPVAAALRREGFPVLVVGGRRFLGLPEVEMVRAFCRVISNPRDDAALVTVVLSAMSAVSDDGVWALRNAEECRAAGAYLWDGMGVAESALEAEDAAAVASLREVIARARERLGAMSLAEVLMRGIEESQADLALLSRGDEGLQAFANVVRFVRKADAFERSGGVGAAEFVARVDAEERFGGQESPSAISDDGAPAVRIMSIHAAKGLEFPVVAIPALGDAEPSGGTTVRVRAREGRLEMALGLPAGWGGKSEHRRTPRFEEVRAEEEAERAGEARRLFYVACTRAREVLLLGGCANLEKDPESVAETPIGLVRRALGSRADGPPGTDEVRDLAGGVRLGVRVHEVADEAQAEEVPEKQESARPPTVPVVAPEEAIRAARVADGVAPTRPERLSYSDISSYRACSLRYWAERVARLGRVDVRPPDEDPMRFGSALHGLLQLARPGQAAPDPQRAEAIARFHRLGASDAKRLSAAAKRFATSRIAAALDACEVVRREYPFAVRIAGPGGGFELVGAIDAYGRTGDVGLIVDYKSGVSRATLDELRARFEVQAMCYAYAALEEGCDRVDVIFVRPEVETADGALQEVAFAFVAEDAARIERMLLGVHRSISDTTYTALDTWDDATCRSCTIAGTLCPLTPPRRVSG